MIGVIDYEMGNVGSVVNMFKRMNIKTVLARGPDSIAAADRLVLPGVGSFDQGMENLDRLGLRDVLECKVIRDRVPILGICLGMQLMTKSSEEGTRPGLGWIDADTVHLRSGCEEVASTLKFPHIGWNYVLAANNHPLIAQLPTDPRFYFVHSYKVMCHSKADMLTCTRHGEIEFTSSFVHKNIVGVQFHPEKSHRFGMRLLRAFSVWDGGSSTELVAGRTSEIVSVREKHRPRVIPVLLLKNGLLYKTVRFRDPKYVGDPRIAVKIFNDKGTDEIILLDIMATVENQRPNFKLVQEIASESFMPLAYGGGIRSEEDVSTLFSLGVEKVIINTHAVEDPAFITRVAKVHGSQSIVVSIDVKRDMLGRYRVMTHGGRKKTKLDPVAFAREAARAGAGEIFVNSVDRDGTFNGYDIPLVSAIAAAVDVPVIACGGAGSVADLGRVVREGRASAAAAGSLFVFQGPHRAVLITFPDDTELRSVFS